MRTSILFAFLLTITASWAQSGLGVKAGGNYSFLSLTKGKDWPSNVPFDTGSLKYEGPGFQGGLYARIQLAKWLDFSPELSFCSRTLKSSNDYSYNYQDTTATQFTYDAKYRQSLTMRYLELPLLLDIKTSFGLRVQLGPVASAMLQYTSTIESEYTTTADGITTGSGKGKDKYEGDAEKGGFNLFEFAVAGGLNYELRNGLNFGVRYQRGLTPVSENSDQVKQYYNVVQLSLGYTFLGKRGGRTPTATVALDTVLSIPSASAPILRDSVAKSADTRSAQAPTSIPPTPPSVAHLPKKEAVPLLQHRVDSLWREVSNTRAKLEAQEAAIAALSAELAKGSAAAAVPAVRKDSIANSSTLATQRVAEPNAGAATPSQVRAAQQADSLSKQWLGEVERDLSRARTIEALNATSEPDDKRYLLTAAELDSVDALLSRITTFALQRCLEVPEYKTKLDPSVIDSHTILHAFSDPWQLDTFQVTTTRKPGGQLMHFMTITSHTGKLLYKEELFVGVLEEGAENCGDSYEQLQVRSAVSCGRFAFPAINARLLGLHIDRARNGRVFDVDEPTWEGIQGDCTAVSFSFRATAEEARVLVYSKQLGKVVNLEPMHP